MFSRILSFKRPQEDKVKIMKPLDVKLKDKVRFYVN